MPLQTQPPTAAVSGQEVPRRLIVTLHDKAMEIHLTPAARQRLERPTEPLRVEMELYFSCLVRKRVLFRGQDDPGPDPGIPWQEVYPGLWLRLRAVVTETCAIDGHVGAPPVKAMPVARKTAVVPRWLCLHHGREGWQGTFGYASPS